LRARHAVGVYEITIDAAFHHTEGHTINRNVLREVEAWARIGAPLTRKLAHAVQVQGQISCAGALAETIHDQDTLLDWRARLGNGRVIHRLYEMLRLPNEQRQAWLQRRAEEAESILRCRLVNCHASSGRCTWRAWHSERLAYASCCGGGDVTTNAGATQAPHADG